MDVSNEAKQHLLETISMTILGDFFVTIVEAIADKEKQQRAVAIINNDESKPEDKLQAFSKIVQEDRELQKVGENFLDTKLPQYINDTVSAYLAVATKEQKEAYFALVQKVVDSTGQE